MRIRKSYLANRWLGTGAYLEVTIIGKMDDLEKLMKIIETECGKNE